MIFVFILVIFFTYRCDSAIELGEVCGSYRTSFGFCTLLGHCSSIKRQLTPEKQPIDLCNNYDFSEPVVCCPLDDSDKEAAENFIEFTTTKTITTTRKALLGATTSPGQIAAKKCYEYAGIVKKLEEHPNFWLNPKTGSELYCGYNSFKIVVIGGTPAQAKEFPHMAVVGYGDKEQKIKWGCGGSLISEKFVLTAAHCLFHHDWGVASWVRLGDLNLISKEDDANAKNFRIIQRIKHPDYMQPSFYHDIALLKLENDVEFNAWMRPACLSTVNNTVEYRSVIATGWGRTDYYDENISENLLKVTLLSVDNGKCNSFYKDDIYSYNQGIIQTLQICAGGIEKDTCQGDSGGPLQVRNTKYKCTYDLIGVTSSGKLCGSVVPGVYTRITEYISWIEDIVWVE